ncbi:hypothetical protein NDU88_004428, partial [Pleurodeles waltl]
MDLRRSIASSLRTAGLTGAGLRCLGQRRCPPSWVSGHRQLNEGLLGGQC